MGLYGAYGWFAGSFANLLGAAWEMYMLHGQLVYQVKLIKRQKEDNKDTSATRAEITSLYVRRTRLAEDIIRCWCDTVVSANAADLPCRVGLPLLNDTWMGILGVISAAIGGCQIWRELK